MITILAEKIEMMFRHHISILSKMLSPCLILNRHALTSALASRLRDYIARRNLKTGLLTSFIFLAIDPF